MINSTLLSIPSYYMSVYPISELVILDVNKAIKSFFWHKEGNGKGIHAVAWRNIIDSKSEGVF